MLRHVFIVLVVIATLGVSSSIASAHLVLQHDDLHQVHDRAESYHMTSDENGIPVEHTEMLWGNYVDKEGNPAIGWHSHDPVTGNARRRPQPSDGEESQQSFSPIDRLVVL